MMAVTVNEKPASLALPVNESVNLVEKIVIGAKEPSTMISRILMSNGSRNHAATAIIAPNAIRQAITLPSSTLSLRLSGISIMSPIIAMAQKAFALANGVMIVTIGCGIVMCRNMNTSISM